MNINRRNFLGVLAGTPLLFSQQNPGRNPGVTEPPVEWKTQMSGDEFECIVGDFRPNLNGHQYSQKIWESMFVGIKTKRGPFVTWSDQYEPALRLDKIVGLITEFRYVFVPTDDEDRLSTIGIKVKMKVMDTPQGRAFRELQARTARMNRQMNIFVGGLPQYLTPVGQCSFVEDIIPDDYVLKYFAISNNSAFESARPLHPIVDGGSALRYQAAFEKRMG